MIELFNIVDKYIIVMKYSESEAEEVRKSLYKKIYNLKYAYEMQDERMINILEKRFEEIELIATTLTNN